MSERNASAHQHFDVSTKGFKHLTPTNEAIRAVLEHLSLKREAAENILISSALHRVLAENLLSPVDVPPFDRAAMDGFAVKAEDTYGASASSPILLKIAGQNGVETVGLKKGEASLIVTGGRMPQGSNAVVMIEYVRESDGGIVELSREVHPMENVSYVGEDIRRGTLVLRAGQRLLPQDLGMLVYLGLTNVKVFRKLKVAVLSTGNEIRDGPTISSGGSIPDVNRPTLLNALRELGCEPIDLGIAADEVDAIRAKLESAILTSDMILVTAGTSVGPRDIVPRVINELGKPGLLVHGVAMRPSMPTGLGVVDGKPIISLPGYPVSAYLAFLEFIPAIIGHLTCTEPLPRPTVKAKLTRRVAGILGSRTYIRVRVHQLEGVTYAEPFSTAGAGILSSLVRTNGFMIVPENVEGYEEGQVVDVELFRPVEKADAGA